MKINLLPEEHRPSASVNIYRLLFMIISSSTFLFLALLIVQQWYTKTTMQTNVKQVSEQLTIYGNSYDNVRSIETMQNTIGQKKQEIKTLKDSFLPIKEVISQSGKVIPDKLWLTQLEIDDQRNIRLAGRSDRMNSIANYMMDLEYSPFFQGTELQTISNTADNNNSNNNDNKAPKMTLFNFGITFQLEKAGSANGK